MSFTAVMDISASDSFLVAYNARQGESGEIIRFKIYDNGIPLDTSQAITYTVKAETPLGHFIQLQATGNSTGCMFNTNANMNAESGYFKRFYVELTFADGSKQTTPDIIYYVVPEANFAGGAGQDYIDKVQAIIDKILADYEKFISDMETEYDEALKKLLDNVNQTIKDLQDEAAEILNGFQTKLDDFNTKLNALTSKVSDIETQLATLQAKMNDLITNGAMTKAQADAAYMHIVPTPVNAQDWNTLTTMGTYSVEMATGANMPDPVDRWGTLLVQGKRHNDSMLTQLFISNNAVWFRRKNGVNTWIAWKKLGADIEGVGLQLIKELDEDTPIIDNWKVLTTSQTAKQYQFITNTIPKPDAAAWEEITGTNLSTMQVKDGVTYDVSTDLSLFMVQFKSELNVIEAVKERKGTTFFEDKGLTTISQQIEYVVANIPLQVLMTAKYTSASGNLSWYLACWDYTTEQWNNTQRIDTGGLNDCIIKFDSSSDWSKWVNPETGIVSFITRTSSYNASGGTMTGSIDYLEFSLQSTSSLKDELKKRIGGADPATAEDIITGESDTLMVTPKGLSEAATSSKAFKEYFGMGKEVQNTTSDSTGYNAIPLGTSVGAINETKRPYTINANGSLTLIRDATLDISLSVKVVAGGTAPMPPFLYWYIMNPQTQLPTGLIPDDVEIVSFGSTRNSDGILNYNWITSGSKTLTLPSGTIINFHMRTNPNAVFRWAQIENVKIEEVLSEPYKALDTGELVDNPVMRYNDVEAFFNEKYKMASIKLDKTAIRPAGVTAGVTDFVAEFRRIGNQVKMFARLNCSAALPNGTEIINLPDGFKVDNAMMATTGNSVWNIPVLAKQYTGYNNANTNQGGIIETSINLMRYSCNQTGNQYLYADFYTADPFPTATDGASITYGQVYKDFETDPYLRESEVEYKLQQMLTNQVGMQMCWGENRQVVDPVNPNFGLFGISDNHKTTNLPTYGEYFTVDSNGVVTVQKDGLYVISAMVKRQWRKPITAWHYVSLVQTKIADGTSTLHDFSPFGGATQNRNRWQCQLTIKLSKGDTIQPKSDSSYTTDNALQFINIDQFKMERIADNEL